MAEAAPTDPCLFYTTGLSTLDVPDVLQSFNVGAERVFVVSHSPDGDFSGIDFHSSDDSSALYDSDVDMEISGARYEDEAAVAKAALDRGITWVMPSPHGVDTLPLSVIAEKMGANYPSPTLVHRIEDKPTFYRLISGDGVPVPESRTCQSAEDIARAVREIGSLSIVKTANGHSSLALKSVDGSRELTTADLQTITDHVLLRDQKGITETVVQESVGTDEFGLQALIEMSNAGIEINWAASTRKIVVPPYGRLSAHIFDPADTERIAVTEDLLVPTVRLALERLAAGAPDLLSSRIGRYALNCDFRTDGNKAWWIDGSFRWAPRFQQLGNASLGEFALSRVMPSIAERWAQGKPVDPSEFNTGKDQRAVIMRKAYTAIGGTVIQMHNPRTKYMPMTVFFAHAPHPGKELPGPNEDCSAAAIDEFPLFCVDGRNIEEAEKTWRDALANHEVAVMRDDVVYGPYSSMAA